MDMNEAMSKRHVVRKYNNKSLSADLIEKLNARREENNKKYNVDIVLVLNDTKAFNAVMKLIFAKGVKNYFILAGTEASDLDERLGYSGADLMLYAQTLGLNTWWAGSTFSKKTTSSLVSGKTVIGVIAVGYGATQGTPHTSKSSEEVSEYNGEAPMWFKKGVEAALLAPTALNKQSFFIRGNEERVSLTCENGVYTGADTGIVKYHFELGAGKDNFQWEINHPF